MQVIFDLDGTLTDSKPGIIACIHHALAQLEVKLGAGVDLEQHIGPPLREVFRRICSNDVNPDLAVELYRARYADTGLFENAVYDGIEDCLSALGNRVDNLYIATSKPTVYAERIVSHFGLERYFKSVYGANLDGTFADKAELLDYLLKSENLAAAECLMIGDRFYDMVAARANGMEAIGVLWGYGSEAELLTAGAQNLCRHPREIRGRILLA